MGQGTESCGGYEVDYDPVEEGLETGEWTQRDGTVIRYTEMSLTHLRNARRYALTRAECCSFSSDADTWREWAELFEREIDNREFAAIKAKRVQTAVAPVKAVVAAKPARGSTVRMKCFCGVEYNARSADLKRGWAQTCSKSCAATKREFGRPNATKVK